MKLQSSQHRGVREEAITSIAVIAGVMEQELTRGFSSLFIGFLLFFHVLFMFFHRISRLLLGFR